ncbi:MAG: inosine-5-monophosphate dehydrogenase [Alphaproteobacteria bacterium]|nr:MAG: inosine-5-monophosphate dehydrogenase [Alphaproteobacteria bacterium]
MQETLVQKLIKRACITLDENSSIKNLVDTLNKNKVGCVVVTSLKSNYPVGIVSERDLVRNYKIILNNKSIKIKDVMTKNIIFCNKNSSSKELMEIMNENKIRHIPIMEQHKLLGIVSIGDVVNRIIENYAYETKHLREYINS